MTPSWRRKTPEMTFERVDCRANDAARPPIPESVSVVSVDESPAIVITAVLSATSTRTPIHWVIEDATAFEAPARNAILRTSLVNKVPTIVIPPRAAANSAIMNQRGFVAGTPEVVMLVEFVRACINSKSASAVCTFRGRDSEVKNVF